MTEASVIRRQDITRLINGLNEMGYYTFQHGPEIIVKEQQRAAKGLSIILGVQCTYLNKYKGGIFEVIPCNPEELLQIISPTPSKGRKGILGLQGEEIAGDLFLQALCDIDHMRKHFPPEYPIESVVHFAQSKSIPIGVQGEEIEVYKRDSIRLRIASLHLIENLWHLQLPDSGMMRIEDELVLDLIYYLEEIQVTIKKQGMNH